MLKLIAPFPGLTIIPADALIFNPLRYLVNRLLTFNRSLDNPLTLFVINTSLLLSNSRTSFMVKVLLPVNLLA